MQHSTQYDVAIVGGGMVGLTLAVALARERVRVAVVERAAYETQLAPSFDGRVSAISLGSQRLLHNIGAWEGMAQQAEPILDIRVSDGEVPFFLHYDHREVGAAPFGYIVENRYIRQALVEAAAGLPNITVIAPATICHSEQGEESLQRSLTYVRDDKKEILQTSLLVGADGKHSQIRQMVGIRAVEANYRQTAIVCTIAHEKPHHGLAQERFLPAGPFAVLPMTHNRSSLVWTEREEHAPVFLNLPEEELLQEIRERVGDYLGEIRLAGKCFAYPLTLVHAKSYTAPRCALVGDAAHGIHPIAGQGVNLGFRDAAVLAEVVLQRFRQGLDIGSEETLAHYQRWRRLDALSMLTVTDGLTRLFSTALPPVALARGLGLWSVSKLPRLKRVFMRHAMGLTGDLPPLMQEAV